MADAAPRKPSEVPTRWEPPSPSAALIPGVLLLFGGLWMVSRGIALGHDDNLR